jgi:hypothetical protein
MKHLLIYLISVVLITSCTEDIDITLDSTYERLVVYGELTTDTTSHIITLSRSMDYYNPQAPRGISNATVTLSWDDHTITLTENDTVPGKYQTASDFFGIPNKTYRLLINNVDIDRDGTLETYEAVADLRPINPIDSVTLGYDPRNEHVTLGLWAQDPQTIDFYMVRYKQNGVLMSDSLREWGITDDVFFNGNSTNGYPVLWLDQKKEHEKVVPGDVLELELMSITEDYFKFILECRISSGFQTPMFSSTPGNVRTNLTNGAMGYFAAYSVSRASTVVLPFKNQK